MKKFQSIIGAALNKYLSLFGLHIKRARAGFWDFDSKFLRIYENIKPKTLVKIDRSYMLYQFAKYAALLPKGDIAQLGIYKGGTAKMIADCFTDTDKTMYLFDTFEGLPSTSDNDSVKNNEKKEFADVNFDAVKTYFSDLKNVEFRKGFFPDSAKGLEDIQFCFVYLDADLYQSTKDGLDFFYPRMVPGGVILIDDYQTKNWPGVALAVDEFCAKANISAVKTAWWQALIIKNNL